MSGIDTQYWLAELDQYGNPKLIDGAHGEVEGVMHAKMLYDRLKFTGDRALAIAKVEITHFKQENNNEIRNTLQERP